MGSEKHKRVRTLLKRWLSVGFPVGSVEKGLKALNNPLEVLRKAVEKIIAKATVLG